MTITFVQKFQDRLGFVAYRLPRNPLTLIITIGSFLVLTFQIIVPAFRTSPVNAPEAVKVFVFVIFELALAFLIIMFWVIITLLTMISTRNKPMFCEKKITLTDEGFIGESPYGKSENRWMTVQKLARTRHYIFMFVNQENAVVIPRRAFGSSTQWDDFYKFCQQKTNQKS